MLVMSKRTQINMRVSPSIKDDLDAISEYHGLTVSSYVHSLIVRELRREREENPTAFSQRQAFKVPANSSLPIKLKGETNATKQKKRA